MSTTRRPLKRQSEQSGPAPFALNGGRRHRDGAVKLGYMYMVDALEAGLVSNADDLRVHGVRMSLAGPQALCGAGPISRNVAGRFAEQHDHVCRACKSAAMLVHREALNTA